MKNPGEIDAWLETMGYYRKNVAYDETCLFRAISEQVDTTLEQVVVVADVFLLFHSCIVRK